MHTGETERLPANLQILASSIIFTLVSYVVFTQMWKIDIHYLFLFIVLALQTVMVLLGNRRTLTSKGAALVSVLVSIGAYFAAVVLLFPSDGVTRIVGITFGAVSAIFILTSTITSFRTEALDLEIIDDLQISVKGDENLSAPDRETEPAPFYSGLEGDLLRETEGEILFNDPIDLSEGLETLIVSGELGSGEAENGKQKDGEALFSDKAPAPGADTAVTGGGEPFLSGNGAPFQPRCHFKVIEAATGNPLGTFYSDEGYSSISPVSLSTLIDGESGPVDLRIVNLDWSNFDEVEVQVERTPHHRDDPGGRNIPADDPEEGEISGGGDAVLPEEHREGKTDLPVGVQELEGIPAVDVETPHYIIYERRTMRPLGEYVPEGDRPRIDRLTLYRMLPEYDFKTFQIDSIRWLEGKIGIFIKGERKKSTKDN